MEFQKTLEQVLDQLRLLNEKVDCVDRRVTSLEHSVDVKMKNIVARQHNQFQRTGSCPLTVLYDMSSGEPIQNFPADLDEVEIMEMGRVEALLRQLGETAQGSEDDRRRQLMLAIGVEYRGL